VRYAVSAVPGADALAARLADPWDDGVVSAAQAIGDLTHLVANTGRRDEGALGSLGQPQSAYQKIMRAELGRAISNIGVPRIQADTVMRLRAIPPGGNHLDLPEALGDRYLTGARWGQDNSSGRLSRRHYYAYRRLHPDIWSWTL